MNNDNFNYDNMSKDELIALLKQKEVQISKQEIIIKNQNVLIQEIIRVIEDKDIKLKEQLCHRFGIKSDSYEVVNDIKLGRDETLANEAEVIIEQMKKRGRKPRTFDCEKFNKDIIDYEEKKIDNNLTKCDICSSKLEFIGTRKYQKIEYIPARIKLVEYEVNRYKCPTCDTIYELDEPINTFDNESFLTPSLASFVVNNKYNYALPLYRQEAILNQLGAPISRQSLANYCIDIASKLKPIYESIKEYLLYNNTGVIHADETTERVILLDNKDKTRKKCYIWLYSTSLYDHQAYVYEHQVSREAAHPQNFLKDYIGYLVCDDYSGYENIPNVKLARCWFHVKKKYADLVKTLTDEQKKNSEAVKIHNMISNIFNEENKLNEKVKSTDELKRQRLLKVKPLVDKYFNYIEGLYNKVDKSSILGKSIKYSINIKADLYRFFEDGHIPMTNNIAERAIKPFVILRKNSLFSYTEKGSQSSCILMSIIQTAKANLIKPDEYIKYILERLDETKQSEIKTLLPWSDKIPETIKYSKKDTEKA